MNEKPEAWTAIDSFVWPHIAANLIREQHAEIKRLKAENAEWQARAATWLASPEAAKRLEGYRKLGEQLAQAEAKIERLTADNEALRRDAERLWEALKHYGKHDDDCGDHDAYNNESLRHCGCGLDAVLDDALTASTAPASAAVDALKEPEDKT
jgi:chromosome segregation ATPase